MGIYTQLYEGKEITFELTNDLTKVVCKHKDHTVSNVNIFSRTTRFVRDENDRICFN